MIGVAPLEEALKLLQYFRVFCTFPITFSEKHKRYHFVHLLSITYIVPLILWWGFSGYTIYTLLMSVENNSMKVWTNVCIKIIKVLIMVRLLIVSNTGKTEIVRFLNWINTFDANIPHNGVYKSLKLIKYIITYKSLIIIIITIVNTISCAIHVNQIHICLEEFVTYSLTFIINSLLLLQFSIFVFMLWSRLRIINNSLTNMVTKGKLDGETVYPPLKYDRKKPSMMLKLLCKQNFEICKYAKLLNAVNSEALLLTIIKAFVDTLNGLHSMLTKDDAFVVIFDISWGLILLIEIIFVLIPCTSTTKTSQRTAEILNMLDTEDDAKLKFEKDMFLLQMIHQRIQFTANDFFPLNETVFVTIFGTTASYLIILIQFESIF